MDQFKQLLETDCTPFVNPMGASSAFIDNKISQATSILDSWEQAEKQADLKNKELEEDKRRKKEAIQSQNIASGTNPNQSGTLSKESDSSNRADSENAGESDSVRSTNDSISIKQEDLTPLKLLSISGINKEDLQELRSCCAEAKKISDVGRNYGKETNADFLSRMITVKTYIQHKGLTTAGEGCNLISSIFTVGAGLGKILLNSLGIEVGKVEGMLGKLNNWIQLGIQSIEMATEIAKRIMQAYQDVKNFIKNIKQTIKQIGEQLKNAIRNELNTLSEMLIYNTRMALAGFLGDFASDPCISGVMNKLGSSALKKLMI